MQKDYRMYYIDFIGKLNNYEIVAWFMIWAYLYVVEFIEYCGWHGICIYSIA